MLPYYCAWWSLYDIGKKTTPEVIGKSISDLAFCCWYFLQGRMYLLRPSLMKTRGFPEFSQRQIYGKRNTLLVSRGLEKLESGFGQPSLNCLSPCVRKSHSWTITANRSEKECDFILLPSPILVISSPFFKMLCGMSLASISHIL